MSKPGFNTALAISGYWLVALAREPKPMLTENVSMHTVSDLGAVKVVPN